MGEIYTRAHNVAAAGRKGTTLNGPAYSFGDVGRGRRVGNLDVVNYRVSFVRMFPEKKKKKKITTIIMTIIIIVNKMNA